MSDTPRTDKYVLAGVQRSRHDMIEFAKKLERELNQRDVEIEQWKVLVEKAHQPKEPT